MKKYYIEKKNEDFSLELDEIRKLRDVILSIIDNFKNDLIEIEYAEKEYFLCSKLNESNEYKLKSAANLESILEKIQ